MSKRKHHPDQLDIFAFTAARERQAATEPTVPQLVKPGTVLETPFRRYIVVVVRPSFYAPDRRQHDQDLTFLGGQGATDTLIPCHHFGMAEEARFLDDPRPRSLRGDSYMNRVVVRGGRLTTLYDNPDASEIVGFNAVAARMIEAGAAV